MTIRQEKWTGLIPSRSPENLPPESGQTFQNIDTRGGALDSLGLNGPLRALHDGTDLTAGIPTSERILIPAGTPGPTAGSAAPKPYASSPMVIQPGSFARMFGELSRGEPWPQTFIEIYAYVFIISYDADGAINWNSSPRIFQLTFLPSPTHPVVYNDVGCSLRASAPSPGYDGFLAEGGTAYSIKGPVYCFKLTGAASPAIAVDRGQPLVTSYLPSNWRPSAAEAGLSAGEYTTLLRSLADSSRIPGGRVELHRWGKGYGLFQVMDVHDSDFSTSQDILYSTDTSYYFYFGPITFDINLNYQGDYRLERYLRFVQTGMTGEREGPESSPSAQVRVGPGEILKISNLGASRRLYQSDPSGIYLRVGTIPQTGYARPTDDQWTGDASSPQTTYQDRGNGLDRTPLPVSGNYNQFLYDKSASDFFDGSIMLHDGGAAAFLNDVDSEGVSRFKVLRTPPRRPYSWSARYQVPLGDETILGIVEVERAIIVFTVERVLSIAWGNLERPDVHELTDSMFLLNALGFAKLVVGGAQAVAWVCADGIALSDGGAVRLVTAGLLTNETFEAFSPAALKAYSGEGMLFLTDGTHKLGVDLSDLGGAGPRLFTFTGGPTGSGLQVPGLTGDRVFRSARFKEPHPIINTYAQIFFEGAGSGTLTLYRENPAGSGTMESNGTVAFGGAGAASGVYTPILVGDADPEAADTWEYGLVWTGLKISRVAIFDRKTVLVGANPLQLTAESNDGLWLDTWAKFPGPDRFIAASLDRPASAEATGTLAWSNRLGTALGSQAIGGSMVRLPNAAADNPRQEVLRLALTVADRFDALLLWREEREAVAQGKQWVPRDSVLPWLYTRLEWPGKRPLGSVRVRFASGGTQTLTLLPDDDETGFNKVISSGREYRLADISNWPDTVGSLALHLNKNDSLAQEIMIWASSMQNVNPNGPTIITGPPWLGNRFKFDDRGTWAAISVLATDYNVGSTIKFYADGSSSAALTLTLAQIGMNCYRIPRTLAEAGVWEISADFVDSTGFEIKLWPRVRQDAGRGPIHGKADDTGMFPWWPAIYDVTDAEEIVSAMVKADAAAYPVSQRLFLDANATDTPDATLAAASAREILVTGLGRPAALGTDFNGKDYQVNEFFLFPREVLSIPNAGIAFPGQTERRNYMGLGLQFLQAGSFSAARFNLSDYTDAWLDLWYAGVRVVHQEITDDQDFKLARDLPVGRGWRLDVNRAGEVLAGYLVGRRTYKAVNGVVKFTRDAEPWSPLGLRVLASYPTLWAWIRIKLADSSMYPVTLKVWNLDQKIIEIPIYSSAPRRLPRIRPLLLAEVDILKGSDVIIEEATMATSRDGAMT